MISYDEQNQLVITLPKSGIELTMLDADKIKGDHLRRMSDAVQQYTSGSFVNIMALVAVCTVKVNRLQPTNDTEGFLTEGQPMNINDLKQKAVNAITVKELLDLPAQDCLSLTEVITKEYSFLSGLG